MDNKPKVLLLGDRSPLGHNLLNLGDQAMLDGARRLFGADAGCEVIAGPWKPFPSFTYRRLKHAARATGPGAVLDDWARQVAAYSEKAARREGALIRWMDRSPLLNNPLVRAADKRVRFATGIGLLDAAKPYLFRQRYAQHLIGLMQQADLVVFLGGGLFAEHLLHYAPAFLLEVHLATRLSRKVIAVSQSVSLTDPLMSEAIGHVYGALDGVLAREPLSRERLLEIGVPGDRVVSCPDAAFGIAPSPGRTDRRLPPGSVAILVRGDRAVDEESWARLVSHLAAGGRTVHALHTCPAHDKPLARRLAARCPLKVADTAHDYHEVIGLMRDCDAVITDRFHAAVFAIHAGTPVVPIRSSTFKTDGLFEFFDYPIDVAPALNAQTYPDLLSRTDRVLGNIPLFKSRIAVAHEQLVALTRREFVTAARKAGA